MQIKRFTGVLQWGFKLEEGILVCYKKFYLRVNGVERKSIKLKIKDPGKAAFGVTRDYLKLSRGLRNF